MSRIYLKQKEPIFGNISFAEIRKFSLSKINVDEGIICFLKPQIFWPHFWDRQGNSEFLHANTQNSLYLQ